MQRWHFLYINSRRTLRFFVKIAIDFNGDICPSLSNIVGGTAEVFGETREIHQGFKRRNPDGTVNHTEIQFK